MTDALPRRFTSPLAQYRAQLQQAFLATPPPGPVHGLHAPAAGGGHGQYTMIDDGTLRIVVELGPLLTHHVFRGSSPWTMVSVWA